MSNSNFKSFKAGTWYVISNFLSKGIVALSMPIITRLLTTEEYGIAGTYNSYLSILLVLAPLNLVASIAVARFDHEDQQYDEYVSSVTFLSAIASLLIFTGIYFLNHLGIPGIDFPDKLLFFMMLNVVFNNAFNILQTKFRSQVKYKLFVTSSILIAILSPILSALFILLSENEKFFGRILGIQLPTMLIGLLMFIYILYKGRTLYNLKYWRYGLGISIPLIPHHLSNIILSQSDRLIINYFRGPSEVGLYTLAYSYSSLLSTVWVSFNQAWSPWFMEKLKEKDYSIIRRIVRPYMVGFSMIYLTMVAIGPEALKVFGPAEYQEGVWIISPVLLALYFQFTYSLYVNAEIYFRQTKYISIGTLFAGVLDLVLNFLLIPDYGFMAAAYSTTFGYLILLMIHFVIANRIIKEDFIGNKFIIKWSVLMVFCTVLLTILTNWIILRYIVYILLMIVIFAIYRNKIFSFVKMLINKNRSKK